MNIYEVYLVGYIYVFFVILEHTVVMYYKTHHMFLSIQAILRET
jgi:hypothetical protein